jgi:hypothetical protein
MKRIVILVLCSACHSFVNSQTLTREQIIGTWTAKEISFSEPVGRTAEDKSAVEKTRRGLVNSQFVFQSNGIFFLKLPGSAPMEFRELESMNNKMWHIKSKERMVFVGSLDEDLMTINVKTSNGVYYFLIRDSPLVMRMEKSR